MKAACASSIGETVLLHRGRGPHHVRRVIYGTQEARPGPLEWFPMGMRCKGRPERRIELRPGVGPVYSTEEAVEQHPDQDSGSGGGKGPAQGEPAWGRQGWDALGNRWQEPTAGKPHAGICEGESRMAELLDHHPNIIWLPGGFKIVRSHFKARFRRENVQFCQLAMSENDGIFGEYVEFERSSQTAKGSFAAEIGVLEWLRTSGTVYSSSLEGF